MKKIIKSIINKIKPNKAKKVEDVKPSIEEKVNTSAPLYRYRMNK